VNGLLPASVKMTEATVTKFLQKSRDLEELPKSDKSAIDGADMNDRQRHALATEFVQRWFEPDDGEPGYPRAMASREVLVMAIGHLIDQAVLESQQEASGGPCVDIETVVRLCVGDV